MKKSNPFISSSWLKRWFACCIAIFLFAQTFAQIPEKPYPPKLVNDFSNLLKPNEREQLEKKLVAYNDSTSTQIVIVIIDDLQNLTPVEFTAQLGEKWGVGQKGKNNGVVILVKPTVENGGRKTFIAPGYGLEAVIPDITAKQIVENELIPNFKEGNYYQGLQQATDVIMALASKEYPASAYEKKHQTSPFTFLIPFIIIALILLIMFKTRGSSTHIGSSGVTTSSGFFFGSGGSFGSSSGGGFGGFGGGSFGGGGAGGSW